MKMVFSFAVLLSAAVAWGGNAYRFVSYNVWGDYFGNPPEERAKLQLAVLQERNPDFIALQEYILI